MFFYLLIYKLYNIMQFVYFCFVVRLAEYLLWNLHSVGYYLFMSKILVLSKILNYSIVNSKIVHWQRSKFIIRFHSVGTNIFEIFFCLYLYYLSTSTTSIYILSLYWKFMKIFPPVCLRPSGIWNCTEIYCWVMSERRSYI